MAKKHLHKINSKLSWLSPWYILILALVFGAISVYSLRQNNLNMIKLRDQVFTADKNGGDIETALKNLREFIYGHMNTSLDSSTSIRPPIQLKYTYDRLVKAQQAKVQAVNNKVYAEAQSYCVSHFAYFTPGNQRYTCVKTYVSSHSVNASSQTIPDSLYEFDFASPFWTPDIAGITLAISIILLLLFAFRLGLDIWLKHELNEHI